MRRRQLLLSIPAFTIARRVFAQESKPSIGVKGINHVTLSVSDVQRSVDFYQGLFGMPVISRQRTTTNLQIGSGPHFLSIAPAGASAPSISQLGLAVENFNIDRVAAILEQHGVMKSDSLGPMRMRLSRRGPEAGGAKEGTPELHFGDTGGLVVQLQDSSYCGGSGALGNVPAREASPKKGLLALRDWSHTTNFVSDGAAAIKFYQDLFGLHIQAYQGPGAPVMGVGDGVHFLMFAGGGGGRGAAAAAPRPASINHLCMSMENFRTEPIIKTLESYGIKPRGSGPAGPLVHYISMRMENRGGAKEGTPELYFTDPDGLPIQLQDVQYCGGGGVLGNVCTR
jgi:catechol 2,3-dioxygenase-like lactoylglutathione lyase family enzyme